MELDQLIIHKRAGEESSDTWRVTAITATFVIVTRNSIEGEPTRYQDIDLITKECKK